MVFKAWERVGNSHTALPRLPLSPVTVDARHPWPYVLVLGPPTPWVRVQTASHVTASGPGPLSSSPCPYSLNKIALRPKRPYTTPRVTSTAAPLPLIILVLRTPGTHIARSHLIPRARRLPPGERGSRAAGIHSGGIESVLL